MNGRLDEMINELKQLYDYIILDSAPVGMVSDTFLINRVVDNTVFVSRQDYTPREMVDLINDVYETKKLNNMSVVLNGIDEASSGFGHGYGYGYGRKD
jgi:Mrp family chromosome partitioning ATPase